MLKKLQRKDVFPADSERNFDMDKETYNEYLALLKKELIPALGCTEPITVAYASAKARSVLGEFPERMVVRCSGNIIKNVKGVTVPNSGGLSGINVAAALGAVGGDESKALEVLESVTEEDITKAQALAAEGFCKCELAENVDNLYVEASSYYGAHYAKVEIAAKHTNITRIEKDGEILFQNKCAPLSSCSEEVPVSSRLNIKDIIEFADTVRLEDIESTIDRQIECNLNIAKEGISNSYGVQVGRTLLKYYDENDVRVRAKAFAAAGSDARMSGCSLPVVINSGSGNQGLTVSLPVIEYAEELKVSHEKLCRALVLANLVSLDQKRYIGSLSAYCGAVCAATGAASGIAYLYGGGYDEISNTITNTICTVGGIVCDGAKPSCAAKIASAVDAAIMGFQMGMKEGNVFKPGQGLVKDDVEKTIRCVGQMASEGMRSTDQKILNLMVES